MNDLTTIDSSELAELAEILGTEVPSGSNKSSLIRVPELKINDKSRNKETKKSIPLGSFYLKGTDKVKSTDNHEGDPTGNSTVKQIVYWHKSGSVFIECVNWSEKITKEKMWGDNLSVGVAVSEFDTWLNTKAY